MDSEEVSQEESVEESEQVSQEEEEEEEQEEEEEEEQEQEQQEEQEEASQEASQQASQQAEEQQEEASEQASQQAEQEEGSEQASQQAEQEEQASQEAEQEESVQQGASDEQSKEQESQQDEAQQQEDQQEDQEEQDQSEEQSENQPAFALGNRFGGQDSESESFSGQDPVPLSTANPFLLSVSQKPPPSPSSHSQGQPQEVASLSIPIELRSFKPKGTRFGTTHKHQTRFMTQARMMTQNRPVVTESMLKKKELYEKCLQQYKSMQEQFEKIRKENIELATQCETYNNSFQQDSVSKNYLNQLIQTINKLQTENTFLEQQNEQYRVKLQNKGIDLPSEQDPKASNKAFRSMQKNISFYQSENKVLAEKTRKTELQIRKFRDDYQRAMLRLKGDQEIKQRFQTLSNAVTQGDILKEELLREIEDLHQKIAVHKYNAQYDKEKLEELIREAKVNLKQEHDLRWKLERTAKVREQEIRNARLSSLQNKTQKVAGKLVTDMELLGKVLSDKLNELGTVENEIDHLQETKRSLQTQIALYRH